MAIKVIVNYPETEEGMRELQDSYARAVIYLLNDKLGPRGLAEVMKRYENKRKKAQ